MHSTSMNMNRELYAELKSICSSYNISMSFLVKAVLKMVYANLEITADSSGLTRYQEKLPAKFWKCFHIEFSENECRDNFNCRGRYRISLSKLFFVGALLFLDKIIEELSGNSENKEKMKYSYTALVNKFLKILKKEIIIFKKNIVKLE
ncbi:MAG: hypothetical protein JW982_10675 [Spirochaetes bacterium]|nr:hypothetical protein [Spirochaetota bacterium]